MSLNTALSIATSGLANINAQFVTMSQNVANVSTPGYVEETTTQQSITAGGIGMGVHTGVATRAANLVLQAALSSQVSTVAQLQTTQTALQGIDTALGTPGQGTDLPSQLGALQTQFATLLNDPSNQTQQAAVVNAAQTLAQGINSLSQTITTQRQAAQDDLAGAVSTLNTTLGQIGTLNEQIVQNRQMGLSTADLESQRDAAVQTLSGLVSIATVAQPTGAIQVITAGGMILPTEPGAATFTAPSGATPPAAYYPGGGLTGITLNGLDVTHALTGGRIGADIALRDTTLPTAQAQLDEFAFGLANRFAGQGLALFTDGQGNVPQAATSGPVQAPYVGFAAAIGVNPAVAANPALVRDGTTPIAGSATGAGPFTPNPSGGPAGFTDMITRVLDYTLTDQAQPGVTQTALGSTGLGPDGNLASPSISTGSLSTIATAMVAGLARQSAAVTGDLTTATAMQTSITTTLTQQTGVNIDKEMTRMLSLQNAYTANARVVNALQTMFNQLLQVVP